MVIERDPETALFSVNRPVLYLALSPFFPRLAYVTKAGGSSKSEGTASSLVVCPRCRQNLRFGHFNLFRRARERNVQKCVPHVQRDHITDF